MQIYPGWLEQLKHVIKPLRSSISQRFDRALLLLQKVFLGRGRSVDAKAEILTPHVSTIPIPSDEPERLKSLKQYCILDTLSEQSYNDLTTIAAEICGTPISLISLIDENRQWFKSRYGIDATETPREYAFCAHAICQPDRMLVVPNALKDHRFANNPLVTSDPNIRFYAGAPLVTSEGLAIGTICVIDHVPRQLTRQQVEALSALSRQTMVQLELRRKTFDLQESQASLERLNQELQKHLESLNQRNADIINLGKVSDFLQRCLTLQEAYEAIPRLLEPLFPGCISYFLPSDSDQKNSADFSSLSPNTRDANLVMRASLKLSEDPWQQSKREPQSQIISRGNQSLDHSPDGTTSQSNRSVENLRDNTLSIAVVSREKFLGTLYLQEITKDSLSSHEKQLLAQTVAEQIALAITNLNLREKLQNESIRDPLTDLFNRRYLEESFDREITRALRHCHSIGAIMLDMDHFKRINDTYGHDAGDYVLQMLSKLLLEHVRGSDIVCRYGGEEMVVILPELSLENTYERAEIIRLEIMNLQLQYKNRSLGPLTASLGIAAFPQHGANSKDVLCAADIALYHAKESGRNQVAIAG